MSEKKTHPGHASLHLSFEWSIIMDGLGIYYMLNHVLRSSCKSHIKVYHEMSELWSEKGAVCVTKPLVVWQVTL
jgi:hypothetical protein